MAPELGDRGGKNPPEALIISANVKARRGFYTNSGAVSRASYALTKLSFSTYTTNEKAY